MGDSRTSVVLLLMLDLLLSGFIVEGAWKLTGEEELEIEKQLRILNKPAAKSIKTEYGDIYDCVDIYKQPAFDHPLLQNHTIQMRPTSFPEGIDYNPSTQGTHTVTGLDEQCPPGTVRIRRTRREDLMRMKGLPRKFASHYSPSSQPPVGDHYGMLVMKSGDRKYYGAVASMDVYNVSNVLEKQFTSSQIIVINGEEKAEEYQNVIQLGWHIDHSVNGDYQTRFFTLWTTDGYRTGCYNIQCSGFVQTSKILTPGDVLKEDAIKIAIFLDQTTGAWWLLVGEGYQTEGYQTVGYFPKDLFNNLAEVSQVQMGGMVFSDFSMPSPPMGSGIFPSADSTKAAQFRELAVMYGGMNLTAPAIENIIGLADLPEYYNVGAFDNTNMLDGFFSYGGPGGFSV